MKRSFIKMALLSLVCSVSAVAMQQGGGYDQGYDQGYGQGKDYKQVKKGEDCADVGQVDQICDKIEKVTKIVDEPCAKQDKASCSSSQQCGSSQWDVGQDFGQSSSCSGYLGCQWVNKDTCGQANQKHWKRKFKGHGARSLSNIWVNKRSFGGKHWNDVSAQNVIFENIMSDSVDWHRSHLQDFVVTGQIKDWEFQNATLQNGLFSGNLRNVRFDNAFLKNVSFAKAKISRGGLREGWEKTRFNGATLDGVSFEGADLRAVDFSNAIIKGNVSFKDAHIHFGTCFVGARLEGCDGGYRLITHQDAERLDAKYQTLGVHAGHSSFRMNEICQFLSSL